VVWPPEWLQIDMEECIRGAVAGPACGESAALGGGNSSTARLTQQQDQDDEGNRNAD